MQFKLLKLMYDYSQQNKLVDKEYIDKLVEMFVKEYNLDDYVKKIEFTSELIKSEDDVCFANYNPLEMNIFIDTESLDIMLKHSSKYDCLFDGYEITMFKNSTITQAILHELEHAYQNKVSDGVDDGTIETKLIKTCYAYEYYLKKGTLEQEIEDNKDNPLRLSELLEILSTQALKNACYLEFYNLDPMERLAQIHSYQTLIKSLEIYKTRIPALYEFQLSSLVEETLNGHLEAWERGGICPTEVYLNVIGRGKAWKELDFYDPDRQKLIDNAVEKHSVTRRLILGLPVTRNEFDDKVDWLVTTNRYSIE